MRYHTSIKQIMASSHDYTKRCGHPPLFLSDWDVDSDATECPHFDYCVYEEEDRPYYYWTDEGGFRDVFAKFYVQSFAKSIDVSSFTIASNGTSSILLSLMGLQELGITNILVFTPVYFSTLNILEKLNFKIIEHPISFETGFDINFDMLEKQFQESDIKAIFATSPIFGSGMELPLSSLTFLVELCNKYGIWLVLDYVYGGLLWDGLKPEDYVFNHNVYTILKKSERSVLIESISKRVFLNGVKIAMIFSSPDFIRRILRLSICTVGSMCYAQLKAFKSLYCIENIAYLAQCMNDTIHQARRTYRSIKSLILGKNFQISNCHSSYFALLKVPKILNINDIEYSIWILKNSGILTIPHSRYQLDCKDGYCFRVNLLKQKEEVISGIMALIDLL